MRSGVRTRREWIGISAALGGHLILLALFAGALEHERRSTSDSPGLTLISIPPREPPRRVMPLPLPQIEDALIVAPAPPDLARPESVETSAPSAAEVTPVIDWRREAERSADRAIRMHTAPKPKGFEARATPEPKRKEKPFGWDPSPGKVGVSGGLPYVELGKRCVLGLGFFGCGLGKLPSANGDLFEGMDDPDRERSSVPDVTRE